MRVLFLTDSLSDLDGVGRYAMCLIAALEEELPGLEVEILLARKHRPTSERIPRRWEVSVALPPDYFFHMAPTRFWPSLAQSVVRVWRSARRADLVHAIKDYPHNLAGLLGARLAGVPCIATGHGTYTVQPLLSPRHGRLARWAYARFAAMITVSRYTRRRVLEILGADGAPRGLTVIPNCVDVEQHARPRDGGPAAWKGGPFTLAIGELKERKGHHLSLAAFCRVAPDFPELRHVIVGKRSGDDYDASLARLAEEAGVADRVLFLGNVDEEEKIELLQRALAFVHTPVTASDGGFEGFGIVYLEAAACGTPAIGTRESGAEDAIEDGVTGFLVEQEVGAVEAALRRLAGDAELRARLGAAGRERAARHTWAGNARAVAALYREALA